MSLILIIVHIAVCVALIMIVLLQTGKGADMGAAFGSGSAGSLFGASGSANFLSRSTAVFAFVFFVSSMGLSYLTYERSSSIGIMSDGELPVSSDVPAPTAPEVPALSDPEPAAGDGSKANEIPN